MRIHVQCGGGGSPRSFHLGVRRLYIVRVLERITKDSEDSFRVRVEDGRVFLLHHDARSGEWRLAGVHSSAAPSRKPGGA